MSLKSIIVKLNTIDREYEESARFEINNYYNGMHYNGSQYVFPDFKSVGNVWIELIKNKESKIKDELSKIITDSGIYISKKSVNKISATIKDIFLEDKYLSCLVRFSEGVARKAEGYGLEFDASFHRFYITNTGYQVAVKNAARAARSRIENYLELCRKKSAPSQIKELNKWLSCIALNPVYTIIVLLLLGSIAIIRFWLNIHE